MERMPVSHKPAGLCAPLREEPSGLGESLRCGLPGGGRLHDVSHFGEDAVDHVRDDPRAVRSRGRFADPGKDGLTGGQLPLVLDLGAQVLPEPGECLIADLAIVIALELDLQILVGSAGVAKYEREFEGLHVLPGIRILSREGALTGL